MNKPGAFALMSEGGNDFSLSAPADQIGQPLIGLAGMTSATFQCAFQPGGGDFDAAAIVFVQTSIDQGSRWCDIAVFEFEGQSGGVQILSVAAGAAPNPVSLTDGDLVSNSASSIVDGVLGDRLRARVQSAGNFTGGSLISVRAVVR